MWLPLVACFALAAAEIADYKTVPKGKNPTLYSSEDHVVQLDETTFNDTVFCTEGDCSSYLVEFYSDWCGHCRSFAPMYKALANDVKGWSDVVKVAAMNCADSVNEATCRANGVAYFPYIKYFPRNSSDAFNASKLRPYHSLAEMRDQLTKVVMDDYSVNRFDDWPSFDFLGDVMTYTELWNGSNPNAQHLAIVFETHSASLTGAQLLLDIHKYSDTLLARRCLKNHPLADALHITDFPSLAIFKRGERIPIMVTELRRLLLTEIEQFLTTSGLKKEENEEKKDETIEKKPDSALQSIQFSSRKTVNKTRQCEDDPESCREQYFVSEVDMLKALRYAIYRETRRTGDALSGGNLTAIHSFLSTLTDHFPTQTTQNGSEVSLDRSSRAVRVFHRLRDFIAEKGDTAIDADEWQREFLTAEAEAGRPFPVTAEWEHCKGSSNQYRGYTCGLWSVFHTLTVNAYKQSEDGVSIQPLSLLQSIRDWVGNFFGCMHCRDHFLKMTGQTYKMEAHVRDPEDIYMYLYRAHNIVNARLKGRDTEDPQFPKYQFPADFLCTNCTVDGKDDDLHSFLLNYYTNIKPAPVDLMDTLERRIRAV